MYFILLLLWIIYNERFNLEVVLIGSIVCGLLYLFMRKFMNYSFRRDMKFFMNIPKYMTFLGIVIKEILKANIEVLKEILLFKKEIKPVIVEFESPLKKKHMQVALANCITLTPGTYTLKLVNGVFMVYGLSEKSVKNIENSIYVQKLKELEVENGV